MVKTSTETNANEKSLEFSKVKKLQDQNQALSASIIERLQNAEQSKIQINIYNEKILETQTQLNEILVDISATNNVIMGNQQKINKLLINIDPEKFKDFLELTTEKEATDISFKVLTAYEEEKLIKEVINQFNVQLPDSLSPENMKEMAVEMKGKKLHPVEDYETKFHAEGRIGYTTGIPGDIYSTKAYDRSKYGDIAMLSHRTKWGLSIIANLKTGKALTDAYYGIREVTINGKEYLKVLGTLNKQHALMNQQGEFVAGFVYYALRNYTSSKQKGYARIKNNRYTQYRKRLEETTAEGVHRSEMFEINEQGKLTRLREPSDSAKILSGNRVTKAKK